MFKSMFMSKGIPPASPAGEGFKPDIEAMVSKDPVFTWTETYPPESMRRLKARDELEKKWLNLALARDLTPDPFPPKKPGVDMTRGNQPSLTILPAENFLTSVQLGKKIFLYRDGILDDDDSIVGQRLQQFQIGLQNWTDCDVLSLAHDRLRKAYMEPISIDSFSTALADLVDGNIAQKRFKVEIWIAYKDAKIAPKYGEQFHPETNTLINDPAFIWYVVSPWKGTPTEILDSVFGDEGCPVPGEKDKLESE